MHPMALSLVLATAVPGTAFQDSLFHLAIEEHVFDNGLRLLVLERPDDRRVAAKIFTDFGAMVEQPGQLGAAHFLEHLMFKGTRTLGTSDWEREEPLVEAIQRTEAALSAELNRARNEIRERGVFHADTDVRTTPLADSLRREIVRLNREAGQYRDNGTMMRWYQAFGGQKLTATTEQEYMKFDINLPVENLELFFRIEADRMRNTVFREFDEERMILVEQRLGDLNRATTPYYEQMNAVVGVVHPVFWPEGYMTDFGQYTRAYQRNLYERYFIPNNTTIVLVGGVTMGAIRSTVDRYFGWMERKPEPPRIQGIEPPPGAERRVIYRSTELAPRVEARFLIPAVGHADRPLFDVIAEVVQLEVQAALNARDIGGRASANTRVVHESRFGVPGSINFEVVLRDESQLEAAEQVLLQVLERLAGGGLDQEALAVAKRKLRNAWYRTLLDADRLAFDIGHFQVMDSWRTLGPYLQAREDVRTNDLARLAKKYFVPENRTVGVVRAPEGATRDVSEAAL